MDPGAETPDTGKFPNIFNKYLQIIAKMHYFSLFYNIFLKDLR